MNEEEKLDIDGILYGMTDFVNDMMEKSAERDQRIRDCCELKNYLAALRVRNAELEVDNEKLKTWDCTYCEFKTKNAELETRVKELETEAFDATFVAVGLMQAFGISAHMKDSYLEDARSWFRAKGEKRYTVKPPEDALSYLTPPPAAKADAQEPEKTNPCPECHGEKIIHETNVTKEGALYDSSILCSLCKGSGQSPARACGKGASYASSKPKSG